MKHHYVPQFLLREWSETTDDGQVEVFRLDLPHIPSSRTTPKYTGYEVDLYALTREVIAGMDKQAIEKRFNRDVDNQGALVLQKLNSGGLRVLTIDDRVRWARFLMSLRIRQPDVVQMLRSEGERHLRATLTAQQKQYEELLGLEDSLSLVKWTEEQYPGLIENIGLSFFHRIVDNPVVGEKILQMKWWLWDFSDVPHDLVLADHPCIFTSGLDDPGLIIALPISPRKAFMATQSVKAAEIMRRQSANELVKRINESSVRQGRVRIYARDKSHARFIRNRR